MVGSLSFLELVGGYSFLVLAVDFSFLELQFLVLVVGFNSQELVVGFSSQEQDEVEGKKERRNSVGPSSSLEMRPLSNFDIENILKGIINFRGVYSKNTLSKLIGEDESTVINIQDC